MHKFQSFFYMVLRHRELQIHVLISLSNKFDILILLLVVNSKYMNKYAANTEKNATKTYLKEKQMQFLFLEQYINLHI